MPFSQTPTHLTLEKLNDWSKAYPKLCLFLDIDGTLSAFEIDPKHSKIPVATLNLLKHLQDVGIPIAIVTGRSLREARQMLAPLEVPIAATHGLEISFLSKPTPSIEPTVQTELALIIAQIEQQIKAQGFSHFLLEKKPYSVALHYRQNPDLAVCVKTLMQTVAKDFVNWQLKQGKFVWEMLPKGADKGVAVTAILTQFNLNQQTPYCPIFIGDDISDEAGFMAVQAMDGIGIKVGESLDYQSCARFFVSDILAVSQVLQQIFEQYYPKKEVVL